MVRDLHSILLESLKDMAVCVPQAALVEVREAGGSCYVFTMVGLRVIGWAQ